MSLTTPPPLPENAALAFAGETAWMPAVITERQAELFRAASNPTRRPNEDVLRGFLRIERGQFVARWQIDFPPHLTEPEAALYEGPWTTLRRKLSVTEAEGWWKNPHGDPVVRSALARLDRYLVVTTEAADLHWTWIDAGWLPDASLVAVARDDDFTQGVLQSRIFLTWWRSHEHPHMPAALVAAFPFPWAVRTEYGALTGIQQDLRFEIARAARNADRTRLDESVATAYGFPPHLEEPELLLRLQRLGRKRRGEA